MNIQIRMQHTSDTPDSHPRAHLTKSLGDPWNGQVPRIGDELMFGYVKNPDGRDQEWIVSNVAWDPNGDVIVDIKPFVGTEDTFEALMRWYEAEGFTTLNGESPLRYAPANA